MDKERVRCNFVHEQKNPSKKWAIELPHRYVIGLTVTTFNSSGIAGGGCISVVYENNNLDIGFISPETGKAIITYLRERGHFDFN